MSEEQNTSTPVPKIYPPTDMGNAQYLADLYGDMLRYVEKVGKWMAWDGKRWDMDSGDIKAEALCRGVAARRWMDISNTSGSDEQRRLFRHWQYTASSSGVRNMLHLARSEPGIAISHELLDSNPFLLNVWDGTIDLTTGEMRPHDQADFLTQMAQVEYRVGVERPAVGRWMECLTTWHPNDDGMIGYLQRLMGYCLTGSIDSRCFPIFWGGGKNGKNTFLDTFLMMLGDYATIAPRTLLDGMKMNEHPTEIACLWKKRLVISSEPEQGNVLRVGLVKSMTGDKVLKGRFMHKDHFDFKTTHKVIMITQHLPKVTETEDAIWDRLHKVEWGVRIPKERQIGGLTDLLREEWSGILRWAIQGCLDWQKDGKFLIPTKKIEKDTTEYRAGQNPAKKFVEMMLLRADGLFISSAELNKMLTEWNGSWDGSTIIAKEELRAYLVGLGCVPDKVKKIGDSSVRCWLGIGRRSQNG